MSSFQGVLDNQFGVRNRDFPSVEETTDKQTSRRKTADSVRVINSFLPIIRQGRNWIESSDIDFFSPIDKERRIDFLVNIYKFRAPSEVRTFLQRNLFLVDLLLEAYEVTQTFFGRNAQISLEVVEDPEASNGRELFALIQTSLPPNDARARLKRLDREWWLDAMLQAQCKMTIDMEYL